MVSFQTTVLILCGVLVAGGVKGYHLHIASNYMMDVEYNDSISRISFMVTATGVTGWVGIGINEGKGNMEGADLFIGGARNTSENKMEKYGDDYHGVGNTSPVRDDNQNWDIVEAKEENGTTWIHVSRLLNTSDVDHDKVIKNETMFLLWSYNTDNDNMTKHSEKGSCRINLVTGDNISCKMDNDSGASAVGIAVSTLLMSLVAILIKH